VPAGAAPPRTLESEHFAFRYDPDRLDARSVAEARDAAERAYVLCQRLFGTEPARVEVDLTPTRFFGATGYAVPGRRPRIAVRFPDLDYLGLRGSYVLAHEVAHIFSGRNAGGPLGEGLADFAANDFAEIPLSPWWGGVLRARGLWVDPDALFITGDYPASSELDARIRIARYTEPALLVQFLVGRFGMERFLKFLPEYARARPSLASNEEPRDRRARPTDREAARASFRAAFGVPWEEIRRRWEESHAAPPASTVVAERMALGQEIYATIRGYELWLTARRVDPGSAEQAAIRRAFVDANRALAQARVAEARGHFVIARRLIDALRRPMLSASAKSAQPIPRAWSLIPRRTARRLDPLARVGESVGSPTRPRRLPAQRRQAGARHETVAERAAGRSDGIRAGGSARGAASGRAAARGHHRAVAARRRLGPAA
jgi:hypothetical protein